jgi:hypothetical protein
MAKWILRRVRVRSLCCFVPVLVLHHRLGNFQFDVNRPFESIRVFDRQASLVTPTTTTP